MKLLDAYYMEFRKYCLESYSNAKQSFGEPEEFVINWPDGPFTSRLFNLGYYVIAGNQRFNSIEDSGIEPYYEAFYSLPIEADIEGIQAIYKKYPAMKGFFINEIAFEEDGHYLSDVKAWFEGNEMSNHDKIGGLKFPQGPYGGSIGEFDNIIYQLLTDYKEKVIQEIKKNEAVNCSYFEAEGEDGGGYFALNANDLYNWRSHNNYQPTAVFLEEYILLFTEDKSYAALWAQKLASLQL